MVFMTMCKIQTFVAQLQPGANDLKEATNLNPGSEISLPDFPKLQNSLAHFFVLIQIRKLVTLGKFGSIFSAPDFPKLQNSLAHFFPSLSFLESQKKRYTRKSWLSYFQLPDSLLWLLFQISQKLLRPPFTVVIRED